MQLVCPFRGQREGARITLRQVHHSLAASADSIKRLQPAQGCTLSEVRCQPPIARVFLQLVGKPGWLWPAEKSGWVKAT